MGDALADAEVVVLALPGGAVADLVAEHGPALAGTIVIDAANRMGAPEFNSRKEITAAAPTAQYVRAFNSLGWENFDDPLPGAGLIFAAGPGARRGGPGPHHGGRAPARIRRGRLTPAGIVDSLLPLWMALVREHGGNRRLALRVLT